MRYSPQIFFRPQQPTPDHQEVRLYYTRIPGEEAIVPRECNKRYVRTSTGNMLNVMVCEFFGPVPEVREASKCPDPLPTYSEERSMLEEEYRHAGETLHV